MVDSSTDLLVAIDPWWIRVQTHWLQLIDGGLDYVLMVDWITCLPGHSCSFVYIYIYSGRVQM